MQRRHGEHHAEAKHEQRIQIAEFLANEYFGNEKPCPLTPLEKLAASGNTNAVKSNKNILKNIATTATNTTSQKHLEEQLYIALYRSTYLAAFYNHSETLNELLNDYYLSQLNAYLLGFMDRVCMEIKDVSQKSTIASLIDKFDNYFSILFTNAISVQNFALCVNEAKKNLEALGTLGCHKTLKTLEENQFFLCSLDFRDLCTLATAAMPTQPEHNPIFANGRKQVLMLLEPFITNKIQNHDYEECLLGKLIRSIPNDNFHQTLFSEIINIYLPNIYSAQTAAAGPRPFRYPLPGRAIPAPALFAHPLNVTPNPVNATIAHEKDEKVTSRSSNIFFFSNNGVDQSPITTTNDRQSSNEKPPTSKTEQRTLIPSRTSETDYAYKDTLLYKTCCQLLNDKSFSESTIEALVKALISNEAELIFQNDRFNLVIGHEYPLIISQKKLASIAKKVQESSENAMLKVASRMIINVIAKHTNNAIQQSSMNEISTKSSHDFKI